MRRERGLVKKRNVPKHISPIVYCLAFAMRTSAQEQEGLIANLPDNSITVETEGRFGVAVRECQTRAIHRTVVVSVAAAELSEAVP